MVCEALGGVESSHTYLNAVAEMRICEETANE